jgi:hypothetical protein
MEHRQTDNDECEMMNDEFPNLSMRVVRKFIIHHFALIISALPV